MDQKHVVDAIEEALCDASGGVNRIKEVSPDLHGYDCVYITMQDGSKFRVSAVLEEEGDED